MGIHKKGFFGKDWDRGQGGSGIIQRVVGSLGEVIHKGGQTNSKKGLGDRVGDMGGGVWWDIGGMGGLEIPIQSTLQLQH